MDDKIKCPHCGYAALAIDRDGKQPKPEAGNKFICGECEKVSVFTSSTTVEPLSLDDMEKEVREAFGDGFVDAMKAVFEQKAISEGEFVANGKMPPGTNMICPNCDNKRGFVCCSDGLSETGAPSTEDIVMCCECSEILQFNPDYTLRPISEKALDELDLMDIQQLKKLSNNYLENKDKLDLSD